MVSTWQTSTHPVMLYVEVVIEDALRLPTILQGCQQYVMGADHLCASPVQAFRLTNNLNLFLNPRLPKSIPARCPNSLTRLPHVLMNTCMFLDMERNVVKCKNVRQAEQPMFPMSHPCFTTAFALHHLLGSCASVCPWLVESDNRSTSHFRN